ncbi:beta-ketoacyl-[acyl-carrier-protein] synthase family protein [Christiangramia flava]|uniref:3-oxoacyl-[acyl-carrier-protein] synthase, KASII n=1 Tax=Christiangramia flava JLT2011 TaxID=1229726 RepID=A0A1L7IAC0_9FLAO|nr:beta-ketoacyl-[acyl-carrier-protein] synthase family protein [Christiangramia flava]APU70055.1 3-oxoacyl-[acyl-carrier-protein] synthase, KASII [Christiangramia flava JLT2011]OSS39540.1 3-oxoacyl-[acyl-carrier-protein] synthase, KASII [Christiangramia flava JLT2011]
MPGVAVTGMGIISSLGTSTAEHLKALKSEKDGITTPEILETSLDLPVAEIKLTNRELAEILHISEPHACTRAALLGIHAVRQLLQHSGWEKFPEGTGFISGTSVGGIDATEKYYYEYAAESSTRRFIKAQHPGFTTDQIAGYFSLNSMVTTINTACSSAANAIMQGARLIESGKLKRVIVGGTDCLTRFTLNGFHSLKILSETKNRAFDEDRDGLNLGEAAAFLMLEADEACQTKNVLGRVAGYGNANDAFHQTASSENGEGAFLAIQKALNKANVSASEIDYINAHGTGTINNDLSESHALKRVFGEKVPTFSSTKGFTGHTLGAAGGVEAVFSLLAIQHQLQFPNLNFKKPIKDTGLSPVTDLSSAKVNRVLSNSFGFGGNCTSLILSDND